MFRSNTHNPSDIKPNKENSDHPTQDPFIQYFRIKIKEGKYSNISEMKEELRPFLFWDSKGSAFTSYIFSNYRDIPIELIVPMQNSLLSEMFPSKLYSPKKTQTADPFIQYLKIKIAEGKSCNIFLMKEKLRTWVWQSDTFKENCINQYPDVPVELIESMQKILWHEMYPNTWFLCRKNAPAEEKEKNPEKDIHSECFNSTRKLGLFCRADKVKYLNQLPHSMSGNSQDQKNYQIRK